MGIGTSLILIAIGAILAFAVTTSVAGISLSTVGWILMIVGAIGLLISLVWARERGEPVARETTTTTRPPPPA